jgi:hypothetical protein
VDNVMPSRIGTRTLCSIRTEAVAGDSASASQCEVTACWRAAVDDAAIHAVKAAMITTRDRRASLSI